MKKIVQSKREDGFTVNIDDDRFSAIKSSHHFAIDPSAPEYKETTETQKLRAVQAAAMTSVKSSLQNESHEDANVIDKIKNRTAQFQNKKDNSKLFKTKNKGVVFSDHTDISAEVKKVKKKKRHLEDSSDKNAKPNDIVKIKKKKRKQLSKNLSDKIPKKHKSA